MGIFLGASEITLIQNNKFVVLNQEIPWSPANLTNVQYWWRADLGVTEAGTGVSVWEDQINGFQMQQSDDANRPSLTTNSNLNNQSVIRCNGTTDFLYTLTTPADRTSGDFTYFAVYRILSSTSNNGVVFGVVQLDGTPTGRIWTDTFSNNQRFFTTGLASATNTNLTANFETPMTVSNTAFKARYDQAIGGAYYAYNTLSETTLGTSGVTGYTTWANNATVAIGAGVIGTGGGVFDSRYINVDVAEAVMIYGTPSTDEMNLWASYVNNRYGTIIT
jgi:hypothetical protein